MNCMKCGREVEEDQAFCQYCLLEMEDHPVKPNTVVLLPDQKAVEIKKTAVRRKKADLSPEEQIPVLKSKLWTLRLLSLVLLIFLSVLGYITFRAISELDIQRLLGQNYSTIITTEPQTEETGGNIIGRSILCVSRETFRLISEIYPAIIQKPNIRRKKWER